jgi:hypothetical protein
MGCGASADIPAPAPSAGNGGERAAPRPKVDDPQEMQKSSGIDRELDRARQQEELKVKLLLLGAGESGKSTVFKQMRILHGSPRTEDDSRMYGVVVRSNVITVMRKLLQLLRSLEMEDQLTQESPSDSEDNLTPKQAYDDLVAHLVDNTAPALDSIPNGDGDDWVGHSARAGLGPNNDAKQFLQLWRPIKVLWEVRFNIAGLLVCVLIMYKSIDTFFFFYFVVENNEGSLAKTFSSKYY